MLDFVFYNMDCMLGMKEFPDKYFDLARVFKENLKLNVCRKGQ